MSHRCQDNTHIAPVSSKEWLIARKFWLYYQWVRQWLFRCLNDKRNTNVLNEYIYISIQKQWILLMTWAMAWYRRTCAMWPKFNAGTEYLVPLFYAWCFLLLLPSWCGHALRIDGTLCMESTSHWAIFLIKGSKAVFWRFILLSWTNCWINSLVVDEFEALYYPCVLFIIGTYLNPTSEGFSFYIYHKRIYFTYINELGSYIKTVPIVFGPQNHQLHLFGVQTTPHAIFPSRCSGG